MESERHWEAFWNDLGPSRDRLLNEPAKALCHAAYRDAWGAALAALERFLEAPDYDPQGDPYDNLQAAYAVKLAIHNFRIKRG